MLHINMPPVLLTDLINMFCTYCLVSDLSLCSSSHRSTAVNLSFQCLFFCVCVCLHACQCLRLCVSNIVFDMTRGDLPSVFSILFLSWHVEPRFSVVMVTVVIDSFSVPRRQICLKCFPLLSGLFLLVLYELG